MSLANLCKAMMLQPSYWMPDYLVTNILLTNIETVPDVSGLTQNGLVGPALERIKEQVSSVHSALELQRFLKVILFPRGR